MSHTRTCLLSVVLLGATCAAHAQTPPSSLPSQSSPPKRDPQALALLAGMHAAMGGPAAAQLRDTETQAQVTTPGLAGTSTTSSVTIRTLGLGSIRSERTTAQGLAVFTATASSSATQDSTGSVQQVSRSSLGNAGISHIPALSILAGWMNASMRAEYLGLETLGSASVHHIRITPALPPETPKELESPCEIYVDAQSFLVAKLVYLVRRPENLRKTMPIEVTYSDYRNVAGIAIPFRVQYGQQGSVLSDYAVTSVSFNRGVAASQFELR